MTRLFIRFYVGVLVVLLLAWLIYGTVLERRSEADTARVILEAHGGGARMVASELNAALPQDRPQVLQRLQATFAYPLNVIPVQKLPNAVRATLSANQDVAYYRFNNRPCIVAALADLTEVVRLGPFPDYGLREIEEAIGGWMRLTAENLEAAQPDERQAKLKLLQQQFDFPVVIANRDDLPASTRSRLVSQEDVVFYGQNPAPNDRWFAATPLANGEDVVRFGPFPNFGQIEQKAATTTLALVLLPAALAIAVLLRPVVRQLRHVERAAQAIAGGDLSARVDERRVHSTRPLAQAFNNMAGRTEALVRTQRELLQAVSHELRTPLARMKFAADLIEMAKDDEERKQRLEALDAATEDLDSLVGELLSYVRMETTQLEINREPIALSEFLEALVPIQAALHPSIQFDREQGVGDEVVVMADTIGLQRVLANLLSNAGRFAKSRVSISAEATGEATIINVDDDGTGIPVPKRESVFEPFVRIEHGSNGHGVGLGLAIVKRIMTQHGGTVEVLTSPTGGCRFRTTWPSPASALRDERE